MAGAASSASSRTTPRHGLGDTGVYLTMAGIALGNWRGCQLCAAQEPCCTPPQHLLAPAGVHILILTVAG